MYYGNCWQNRLLRSPESQILLTTLYDHTREVGELDTLLVPPHLLS